MRFEDNLDVMMQVMQIPHNKAHNATTGRKRQTEGPQVLIKPTAKNAADVVVVVEVVSVVTMAAAVVKTGGVVETGRHSNVDSGRN